MKNLGLLSAQLPKVRKTLFINLNGIFRRGDLNTTREKATRDQNESYREKNRRRPETMSSRDYHRRNEDHRRDRDYRKGYSTNQASRYR